MWRALRKQRQSTLLQLQKPNCAEACFSKPETHRQRQGLPAKPRTPNVALPLEPSQIHPVSISEPSPVCYSSPGLHRADVLQQTKAAIYELDHTWIDNAVQDIVPVASRLNDPTVRKALELVTDGLRFHSKLRC
jgi:hypothetical protein